jgi:hypothetical protein
MLAFARPVISTKAGLNEAFVGAEKRLYVHSGGTGEAGADGHADKLALVVLMISRDFSQDE